MIREHAPEVQAKLGGYNYLDSSELTSALADDDSLVDKSFIFGGIITEVNIRTTKKLEQFAQIVLDSNNEKVSVTFWNPEWKMHKDKLEGAVGKLFLGSGIVKKYNGGLSYHFYCTEENYERNRSTLNHGKHVFQIL